MKRIYFEINLLLMLKKVIFAYKYNKYNNEKGYQRQIKSVA